MMEYYPTLIEAAVEFRIHSRILLAQREGNYYSFLLLSKENLMRFNQNMKQCRWQKAISSKRTQGQGSTTH